MRYNDELTLKGTFMHNHTYKKGIIIMIVQAVMFAMLYMFSSWLHPLSGTSVWAWRMLGMFVGLLVLLHISGQWLAMRAFLVSLKGNKLLSKKGVMMLATTPIIASQLWLFMWAGVNGHAVDVSIGYLLFPLTMVFGGWLFAKAKVTKLQWLALGLAGVGVAYQVWQTLAFSWATFWVCGLYPVYYLLRRQFAVPALLGLTFDLALIFPFALLYLLVYGEFALLLQPSKFWLLIPALGLLSAWAMQLNLDASRLLPVPLFGILSYLEPSLMFLLSVSVLGDHLSLMMLVSFGFICLGLVVSVLDGVFKLKNNTVIQKP